MCNTEVQTIGSCVTVMRGMLVMCNIEIDNWVMCTSNERHAGDVQH